MKKVLFLISIAAFILAGCEKTEKEEPYMTFEEAVKADFTYMQGVAAGSKLHFYETECVLNGFISEMAAKDVKILCCTSVAAAARVVHFLDTDFKTGERTESSVKGSWAGSFTIDDPTAMAISFEKAVDILLGQSAVPVPASDKCTFRHPQGTLPNPLYIFGSNHSFYVGVDAMTGEVISLGEGDELNGTLSQDDAE